MIVQRNIRLLIAFDGTNFNGWQRQKHDITIQGEIEKCLDRMTNTQIMLHGAGRTDAGVHAEGMVAHFSTSSSISADAFVKGLNSMLPYAIRVLAANEVDSEFHSRFSAKGKHYDYSLYAGKIMPPCERLYALHVPCDLNFPKMSSAIEYILGTHDFSTFENAGSRDKDKPSRKGAIRTITTARIDNTAEHRYSITVIGEGFLRHMVRNIVGTLLEVGKNKRTVEEFKRCLKEKDRCAGGATAPPQGLTLKKVFY